MNQVASETVQEYSFTDELVNNTVSVSSVEADVLLNLKQPSVPIAIPDAVFGVGAGAAVKTWKWGEWYIPPPGQGRTIIHMYPVLTLTLVRTTDPSGNPVQYLNLHIPNVRVWNPFDKAPRLHAVVMDRAGGVLVDADFGSPQGGCGALSAFTQTVRLNVDIFDVAQLARPYMTGFTWWPC